jgi:hypothetical protein
MVKRRETIAVATTAWLFIVGVLLGQAPAEKPALTPRAFREARAKAHEICTRISKTEDEGEKENAKKEFAKLVVDCRASFPEVKAAVGDRARYARVTLNAHGGGFDAIRFRVPSAGRTYELFYAFVVPGPVKTQNIEALSILAANGDEMVLNYPEILENVTIPGMNLPQPNWWRHARLYGRKLQAGQEYLLWFDLKADQPLPLVMKIRIEPIETAEPPHTPALKSARADFQTALEKLSIRFDEDAKAIRRKYLDELGRASKAPSTSKKKAPTPEEFLAEADRANLGDSETSDPRGFHIIRAETGVGGQWNDVTPQVRAFVRGDRLKDNAADFDFKQDAAFGIGKTLIIVYTVDGKPGFYAAPSDRNVDLPPSAGASPEKK